MANARTSVWITSWLISTRLCPLSVERKTPPAQFTKSAPGKMSPAALIARQLSYNAESPLFIFCHAWPPSVERNIPMPYSASEQRVSHSDSYGSHLGRLTPVELGQ